MKISIRSFRAKGSLPEQPANTGTWGPSIQNQPHLWKIAPQMYLHSFVLPVWETRVTPEKVRENRIGCSPQGMLVGQAMKIICKHHKLLLQQQSMAINRHTTSSESLEIVFL